MTEITFPHLWSLQENFYADRPLMYQANTDVLTLLKRIEDETKECAEAITLCMASTPLDTCVDLLTQDIRQEISDLFLFVMALGRCIGLTGSQIVEDSAEKIARNMGRYNAKDYQDTSQVYVDVAEQSRRSDKTRGFTRDFYQIPAA